VPIRRKAPLTKEQIELDEPVKLSAFEDFNDGMSVDEMLDIVEDDFFTNEAGLIILNQRQNDFCEFYAIDGNGSEAARKAGYNTKSAGSWATYLLKNPSIQKKVQIFKLRRSKAIDFDANKILGRLAKIAFAEPRKLFDDQENLLPPSQWPDDIAGAITGIEPTRYGLKVKLADPNKALEKLGEYLKLFVNGAMITNNNTMDLSFLKDLTVEQLQKIVEAGGAKP
jgi:phage terminase small subunit